MATARRLWIGFGVQAALLVVSVTTIAALLVGIDRQSEALATSRARSAEAREIEINVLGFAASVQQHLHLGDPAAAAAARTDAEAVERALAAYRDLATTPARQTLAAAVTPLWRALRQTGETFLGRVPGQTTPAEIAQFAGLLGAIERQLDERVQPEAVGAFTEAFTRSSELIGNAVTVAAIFLLLGLTASVATARVVARRVSGTEADLVRRSAQLRSTFDAMQDGVAVFDGNANLIQANNALAAMHGYASPLEMEQHLSRFQETFELFDASGAELPIERWPASRVLAGESYSNLDLRVRRRDTGLDKVLSYSARPISGNGGPSHAIIVVRDVTDSLRVQREFDEQRHLLHAVFDAAPALIYVKDREGRFRVANRAVGELLGATPEDLLGRTAEGFERVAARDGAGALEGEEASQSGRSRFQQSVTDPSTGNVRWFETIEGSLEMPASGETLLLGIATDVTERRRSEEARATSEKRLRVLLESMPDAVVAVNHAGAVVFASSKAERFFGRRAAELVGQPMEILVAAEQRELLASLRRRYLESGAPRGVGVARRELTALRRDGSTVPVEVSFSPTSTPEGPIVTCIVRDLTPTRALEDQLRQAQKMEAVGQLTGGIAHDLNNVLTVIMSNAEMIAASLPEQAASKEDVAELLGAASRGSNMIQRLLHFSRRAPLSKQPVRPGEVVMGLAPMLRRLLPESIQVRLRDATRPEDAVLGDSVAIEQMIVNLCTNARDAMPRGGTLRIEGDRAALDESYQATHPWVLPGAYVCVSVSDDGAGMDETTQRRVFEPFFTTKPPSEGTGLGMAMVYGTMKQHGGMVHVYSELGRGTTIKLYFPIAGATSLEVPAPTESAERRTATGGTETILLAEDEPGIRRTTRRALEGKGYRVIVAEDGEAALQLYRQHRDQIDLVISDLVMPKLGGRQLVEAMRSEGSDVQVLFTSGYSTDTVNGAGDLQPGVAFLQKPWTLDDLFARVRDLLDRA
jgi:PAS domain S-box-containing protein